MTAVKALVNQKELIDTVLWDNTIDLDCRRSFIMYECLFAPQRSSSIEDVVEVHFEEINVTMRDKFELVIKEATL